MRISLLDQDLVKQSHQPQCEQLLPVLAPPQEAVFITGPRDDKKLIKDVIIRAGPLPSVSEFELFHWILNLIFFVSHSLIIKTPEEYLDKMYTSGFKKLNLVMSTEQER